MQSIKFHCPLWAVLGILYLLLMVKSQAQSSWKLTYEFPGGPKTGITLAADSCLFVSTLTGVLRSCNDGDSFETSLRSTPIANIFTARSGKILAGAEGKIYTTDDLGQTWDSVSIPTFYPFIQIIDTPAGGLFAITGADIGFGGDGVFYSADGGRTWVERNNGLSQLERNCQRITVDRNGRLYVAIADENAVGAGGLFISENEGLLWERVHIRFDGKGDVENQLRINSTTGLSVSPQDSVYLSFSGLSLAGGTNNGLVELNLRKHIDDIKTSSTFWTWLQISKSVNWWMGRILNNIHFSRTGQRFSSVSGTISIGATYYSTGSNGQWNRLDAGLGASILSMRTAQFFAEKSNGRLFMVQYLDERIYQMDTDRPTPVKIPAKPLDPIRVYPNPASPGQPFYLQAPESLQNYSIQVFDTLGRRYGAKQDVNGETAVIAPAMPGFYFVHIEAGKKGKTLPLIVQ